MSGNYFDQLYTTSKQYFGDHPENILRNYYSICNKKGRILDIGIGQGRNARFLLQQGFGVDGIDPSSVAIEGLENLKRNENLDLKLFHMDYTRFIGPPRTYSAILMINLFPVLSEGQIADLVQKARIWLKRKGIIFVTGYTTSETTSSPLSKDWNKVSDKSYVDDKSNYRTFLDADDVIAKFRKFRPIYRWEGFGERHSHDTDKIEQHHIFELILQNV